MSIKLKLTGFDDLIKEIEKANGNIDKACDSAIRQGADIMQKELKAQMQAAGVSNRLISSMPANEIKHSGNTFIARVGYEKGTYDPKNPSDAYKVIFLNYGTPHRKKHGKVKARGFIEKAKSKARRKIKKGQEQAFNKILERLKR